MPLRRSTPLLFVCALTTTSASCKNGSRSAVLNACGHYFDVTHGIACSAPTLPSALASHARARYEQECAQELSLPATLVTFAQLDACADALEQQGCVALPPPSACQLPGGGLSNGSSCHQSWQCQSSNCQLMSTVIADGGTTSSVCGACQPSATSTVTVVGIGATCDGASVVCNVGLTCDAQHHCAAPAGIGQACSGAGSCQGALVCSAASVCQARAAAGGSCAVDTDCDPSLACDAATGTCRDFFWAEGGQACGATTRCLVGSCPASNASTGIAGVCPTVVADALPCNAADATSTCDLYSSCVQGICTLQALTLCP